MKRPIALLMIALALVGVLPWRASATPPFPKEMQKKLNELVGASGNTYRSNEAIDVLLDQYLTSRPGTMTSQQALNALLSLAATSKVNTTQKARLCVVVDDQLKEWWNGTVNGRSIRTLCKTNGLKLGFSIGAYYIEKGDTVNNTLSVSNLRNMVDHDGDEIGSGGYFEGTQGGALGNWWHGDTGHLVRGDYTQSQLDAAMDLHFAGNVRALRDTLNFDVKKWHSHSNSSGSDIVYPYMVAAGFLYGVSSITGASSSFTRPNTWYPAVQAQWGRWGTGGAVASFVSAIPGQHNSRWEIAQTVTESMTLAQCKAATQAAEQLNALLCYNLHAASVHNTTLGGGDGWKTLLEYWAGEVAAGRLEIVLPSVAFPMYYDNKWSDASQWGTKDFQDLDADGKIDMWAANRGQAANADTALINLYSSSSTYKYAGHKTMRLNWGTASGNTPGDGFLALAPDQPWEFGCAWKAVAVPAGGGWTITANMRTICDTAVPSGIAPSGKYVGIDFFAPHARDSYQYAVSAAINFDYTGAISSTVNYLQDQMSMRGMGESNRPGTQYTFGATNTIQTGAGTREWLFIEESWDVPEHAQFVLVNVFKENTLVANEVIITDPVIHFYNRNTGEVIDAQDVIR